MKALPLLGVEKISHRFGGLLAIKDVSFSIEQGEILALIGPNGAGKTTLFNIIAGVYKPTEGKIFYDGTDITGQPSAKVARLGIIRTFQATSLFPESTVIENILIARYRSQQSSLRSIIFNLAKVKQEEERDYLKALEIIRILGLGHRLDELAKNLPYGEQRLLAIGVALGAEPTLLMLDEPAAGLNQTETYNLMLLIKGLQQSGITIFLVEHDMSLVMGLSERIIVVSNGEKIAEGNPLEIQENQEVIKAYLGEDFDYADL